MPKLSFSTMSKRKTKSAFFYTNRVQNNYFRFRKVNKRKTSVTCCLLKSLQAKIDTADIQFRMICRCTKTGIYKGIINEKPNLDKAKEIYHIFTKTVFECEKLLTKCNGKNITNKNEARWLYKLSRKVHYYNKLIKINS